MIAYKNPTQWERHCKNVNFQKRLAQVEKLSDKNGIRYLIYYDKLLRHYSSMDTYKNFVEKRVPRCEIICEVDYE